MRVRLISLLSLQRLQLRGWAADIATTTLPSSLLAVICTPHFLWGSASNSYSSCPTHAPHQCWHPLHHKVHCGDVSVSGLLWCLLVWPLVLDHHCTARHSALPLVLLLPVFLLPVLVPAGCGVYLFVHRRRRHAQPAAAGNVSAAGGGSCCFTWQCCWWGPSCSCHAGSAAEGASAHALPAAR